MSPLFTINGKVITGKKRGKKLGFPTANIKADNSLPKGTYVSKIYLEESAHESITFIGTVDTFDEADFVAETYILNFDQDIYGKEIKIQILKKLRDNQKFESVEKLIKQMKEDQKKTEEYFKSQT